MTLVIQVLLVLKELHDLWVLQVHNDQQVQQELSETQELQVLRELHDHKVWQVQQEQQEQLVLKGYKVQQVL